MAKDPAFLFYPGDWLGGTMLMSRHHKGAYMDLLMAQFNNGHMALHEIKTLLGKEDESLWETVLCKKFKQDSEGKFYNEKLDTEKLKRREYTSGRKNNLNNVKEKIKEHMSTHMEAHMENENENVIDNDLKEEGVQGKENPIIEIPFHYFWKLYDKNVDQEKAEETWNTLTEQEKANCILTVRAYVLSTPEKKFRKDPVNYLQNKAWKNEIVIPKSEAPFTFKTHSQMLIDQCWDTWLPVQLPDKAKVVWVKDSDIEKHNLAMYKVPTNNKLTAAKTN